MSINIEFRGKQFRRVQRFPEKYADCGWIYGWVHSSYDGSFYTYISNINDDKMETETFNVEASTICQWINLHDKNGKKIYEKDIVFIEDNGGNKHKYLVDFYKGSFVAKLVGAKRESYKTFLLINTGYIEVIGNIFDNPGLFQ